MRRSSGSGRFKKSAGEGEDINPLDGVANLADVMLVFACGLMLALITFWNVDVAQTADSSPEDTSSPLEITEDVAGGADAAEETGEGLEEYGTVFIDPETGKLYMVAD